jgi:hypothetical protein
MVVQTIGVFPPVFAKNYNTENTYILIYLATNTLQKPNQLSIMGCIIY